MNNQSTRTILLTNGDVTIVNAEDCDELSQYTWTAHYSHTTRSWYAVRTQGKGNTISMSRHLLGLKRGNQLQADHINHDTLDNTRGNLRIVTASQKCQNRTRRTDNKSGYKGVSWNKEHKVWRTQIWINGKNKFIGHYEDLLEAAIAYDNRAILEFGEFSYLNFQQDSTEMKVAA